MGLEGVREAARRDRRVRFTALLHHITPELLESSFHALRHPRRREDTAFASIEVFYTRKRLHSILGYTSPALFLNDWINTREGEKQVA